MGNVLNGLIRLFKRKLLWSGVTSLFSVHYRILTVRYLSQSYYLVHRKSAAEASVPVVHTTAYYSQW